MLAQHLGDGGVWTPIGVPTIDGQRNFVGLENDDTTHTPLIGRAAAFR